MNRSLCLFHNARYLNRESQAPYGGLAGEPTLSLLKGQLYTGWLSRIRVRPLTLPYPSGRCQLVAKYRKAAFTELFHLNYSVVHLISKNFYCLVPSMDSQGTLRVPTCCHTPCGRFGLISKFCGSSQVQYRATGTRLC